MKFLISKNLRNNPFLKSLILGLLVFIIIFLLLDITLYHVQIGLSFDKAIASILGDEEEFIEPILFDTLLIMIHSNLFFSMLLLLILSAIWVRLWELKSKLLLHLLFILAIITPLFLLLGYFYGSFVVKIWVILFLLWHFLAIFMSVESIIGIYKNG